MMQKMPKVEERKRRTIRHLKRVLGKIRNTMTGKGYIAYDPKILQIGTTKTDF